MVNTKKQSSYKENSGKLLLDLGKLVFGSLFLGGVLRGEIPQLLLVIGGFAVASMFCFFGLLILKKNDEKANSKD